MNQQTFYGILELDGRRGGRLRQHSLMIDRHPDDPHVTPDLISKWKLRDGSGVEGSVTGNGRGGRKISVVTAVNGLPPHDWASREEYQSLTAIDPVVRIHLSGPSADTSMRIVDLVAPVGKGQRALIVSPPKAGKTMLMQSFAHTIGAAHPEIDLLILLVDERPEEVTDMRRTIKGEVFASSNDHDAEAHARLAKLVLEYAKRKVEAGRDVVILLDSLTRLGRVFNSVQRGSGRTMSGGVDIRALEIPKRIFGAARALEGGGSLTIIATALIDTNSRMDELIFQEFKGTGNMELILSRDLANERIFPAINVVESGTRREELLFKSETPKYHALRRALNKMKPKEAILLLLKGVADYPTNRRLLARFASENVAV
ncbi:MAG TPA: transcription termination factor Rho [Bacteroidota bacterium]|nr:transcription termination factor Rho [Bacteroidota bacterium]